MHPLPFAPRGHNTSLSEIRKMPRNLWLAQSQDFDQIADADFTASNEVEQAQPGGIGKSSKQRNQTR
jgi:hypothetical protein